MGSTSNSATYAGVILDYDGTLCDEKHRFDPLPDEMSKQISRVLLTGAILGVATGRGKSAKEALRRSIDHRFWSQVVVGYYNGGDIALLEDHTRPDGTEAVDEPLAGVAEALQADAVLSGLATLTFRRRQITVEPRPDSYSEEVWALVEHLLCRVGAAGVAALRSSHSMDIVAPGVCKRAVIDRVLELSRRKVDLPVLCVGDRGRWPGNDASLLSGPHTLSVDEVSPDPTTGWNLAEPGRRGPFVTMGYLEGLRSTRPGLRIKIR